MKQTSHDALLETSSTTRSFIVIGLIKQVRDHALVWCCAHSNRSTHHLLVTNKPTSQENTLL